MHCMYHCNFCICKMNIISTVQVMIFCRILMYTKMFMVNIQYVHALYEYLYIYIMLTCTICIRAIFVHAKYVYSQHLHAQLLYIRFPVCTHSFYVRSHTMYSYMQDFTVSCVYIRNIHTSYTYHETSTV